MPKFSLIDHIVSKLTLAFQIFVQRYVIGVFFTPVTLPTSDIDGSVAVALSCQTIAHIIVPANRTREIAFTCWKKDIIESQITYQFVEQNRESGIYYR